MKSFVKLKSKSGFTLVECIIAILVFAIMSLLVMTLLSLSIQQHSDNMRSTRAMGAQRQQLSNGKIIKDDGTVELDGAGNPVAATEVEEGWGVIDFIFSETGGADGIFSVAFGLDRITPVEENDLQLNGFNSPTGDGRTGLIPPATATTPPEGETEPPASTTPPVVAPPEAGRDTFFNASKITGVTGLDVISLKKASGNVPQGQVTGTPATLYDGGYGTNSVTVWAYTFNVSIKDNRAVSNAGFRSSIEIKLPGGAHSNDDLKVLGVKSATPNSLQGSNNTPPKITYEGYDNILKVRRSNTWESGIATGNFQSYSCDVTVYFDKDPGELMVWWFDGATNGNHAVNYCENIKYPGAYFTSKSATGLDGLTYSCGHTPRHSDQ
ncbi:MAG: type II secretion system GspH family protein [Oscillospiraceae bacterium]|jgi:prepilin-type N-terminal cleavage/methylation domain-containing protein|nr:type II secretion system GspH family protein [Oscillospiraceae bacterium]